MGRFARWLALACLLAALDAHAAEIYVTSRAAPTTPVLLDPANLGQPERRLPVLFIHGHNPDSADDTAAAGPNYQQNFWNPLGALTSFKRTLDHGDNAGLGIEPYFIRFQDQNRSITEDARDIGEAIDLIVQRHNPGFATAGATTSPPVQVVIVAYSKGTISARQYLKSLTTAVQDAGGTPLPAPRPAYRPVSEFIALSPPNHAINLPILGQSLNSLSRQQLNNGYGGVLCNALGAPAASDYIQILNGHPIADTQSAPFGSFASEAPGSRPPLASSPPGAPPTPPSAGTLYTTIYATNDADLVGGDNPSSDCQGRKVARNLAPDAVNIPLGGIGGANEGEVHANTVHTASAICLALLTAVHHRAPPTGQSCPTNADGVPVVPLPPQAAAMLTLDISGSMNLPACPGCPTRLAVLKDAVEIFARLWSVMGRDEDALGVTYFRTSVDPFAINGNVLPSIGFVDALIADIRAQDIQPQNLMTAMGGGLQSAVDALRAAPATTGPRHVILFTDGMQNVNPMVLPNPADPAHLVIDNDATPGRTASNVAPTVPPMTLNALGGISIDTIGIGTGQAFLDLLADIAGETGGDTKATVAANDDLRRFFVEELVNALRGFSPQLVGYRRGTLGDSRANEEFIVNRGVRKIAFILNWPHGKPLDLRILKDGTDVTGAARVVTGEFFRIYSFAFPGTGGVAAPDGRWRMTIGGKPKTAYEAAALADDSTLAYRVRLGARREKVDQPIALDVQVLGDKQPIDGTVTVTATIERPQRAAGNILGPVALFEGTKTAGEPGQSFAERRHLALPGDSSRWAMLANPLRSTIRIEPDGKGNFHATIGDVTTPGLYRAIVHIKGEDSRLGAFERTETATTVVRFNEADLNRSQILLRPLPNKSVIELTLRPRDAHGNLLGPGLPREVVVALAGGRRVDGPADLGDGRYRFALFAAKGEDAAIAIEVAGRSLFKGTLKELRKRSGG